MTLRARSPLHTSLVHAGLVHAGLVVLALLPVGPTAGAQEPVVGPAVLQSVVSVLPLWPGYEQGGSGDVPPGTAPEGSAVAFRAGGYLVTALHVVERAVEIDVRLPDGRLQMAELVAGDPASDLAVLRIAADLPPLALAREPRLGAPVCAVGNQFGLGLSMTCGVISALGLTAVGFNTIEDFIQTDAVVNPGSSGGALVDGEGRLVGVLSAIFTKGSDANIGVNFAASAALVARVAADLIERGRVAPVPPGFRVADLTRAERRMQVGARVIGVLPGSAAARAGLSQDDVVVAVGSRTTRRASDVTTALYLHRPGETVAIQVLRAGQPVTVRLELPQ
jgi:S1-C subfamily serine protease